MISGNVEAPHYVTRMTTIKRAINGRNGPCNFLTSLALSLVLFMGLCGHIEPIGQLRSGFIKECLGHLKSLANSSDSINDPMRRYDIGACTPVNCLLRVFSLALWHHWCALRIQNSWRWLKSVKPGNKGSSPWSLTHDSNKNGVNGFRN